MEIERKYEVRNVPEDLSVYKKKHIEQGYLCHNPTIRIRRSNGDYILTYKSKLGIPQDWEGSPLMNHEVELQLRGEAYEHLKSKTDHNMIYKTRYLIPLDQGLTAELDIFEGKLKGFVMVEVEFPDERSSMEFTPPVWFGKELSSDKRYSNYNLSKIESLEELQQHFII